MSLPINNHATLFANEPDGSSRPATADEILAAARTVLARRIRRGTPMDSPRATREYLAMKLGDRDHEVFCCLYLDTRHRLIEFVELFRGTIDGASAYSTRT